MGGNHWNFAQYLAIGYQPEEAFRLAGFEGTAADAAALARHPAIMVLVYELREYSGNPAAWTVQALAARYNAIIDMAMHEKQLTAAVAALDSLTRLRACMPLPQQPTAHVHEEQVAPGRRSAVDCWLSHGAPFWGSA